MQPWWRRRRRWLAGWLFGWGCCGKGCHQSSPRPPPRSSSSHLPCTTNQIQMHIPNNRCTHSRAVDEIMVDCTLHAAVVHTASPMSPLARSLFLLLLVFSVRKIRASRASRFSRLFAVPRGAVIRLSWSEIYQLPIGRAEVKIDREIRWLGQPVR